MLIPWILGTLLLDKAAKSADHMVHGTSRCSRSRLPKERLLFIGEFPKDGTQFKLASIYTAGLKVRMPFWWRQVDLEIHFRVPREKFGRHSNPIYLVLKHLNKSGTAF